MKVDDALINKLAKLARLEFADSEKIAMKNDMERLIGFVEQLNEVDTTGIEPLIHMSDEMNVFRADEVSDELSQASALKNAPDHDSFYFKVPKVVENPDTKE